MPIKPQISKFEAEKSYQVGFSVLRRLYSWAFVKRVNSFVHVSISFVCNILSVEIAHGLFGLNLKYSSSVLNVDYKTSAIDKLQAVSFQTCYYGVCQEAWKLWKPFKPLLRKRDEKLREVNELHESNGGKSTRHDETTTGDIRKSRCWRQRWYQLQVRTDAGTVNRKDRFATTRMSRELIDEVQGRRLNYYNRPTREAIPRGHSELIRRSSDIDIDASATCWLL